MGRPGQLSAGMVGEIVELNEQPETPLLVRFPGYQYPVDVLDEYLELFPSAGSSSS
jgi:hypothetical protein